MEIFLPPSSSPLFKNGNAYLVLYPLEGGYDFLEMLELVYGDLRSQGRPNSDIYGYCLPRNTKPFSASKPRRSFLAHGWDADGSCMSLRSHEKGQKFDTA